MPYPHRLPLSWRLAVASKKCICVGLLRGFGFAMCEQNELPSVVDICDMYNYRAMGLFYNNPDPSKEEYRYSGNKKHTI